MKNALETFDEIVKISLMKQSLCRGARLGSFIRIVLSRKGLSCSSLFSFFSKTFFSPRLLKLSTYFYIPLIDDPAGIFPTSFSTTRISTHISFAAPLLRDLNPGPFDDWVTTLWHSQQISLKLKSLLKVLPGIEASLGSFLLSRKDILKMPPRFAGKPGSEKKLRKLKILI